MFDRWCTGYREDNGRKIHKGYCRLHQRPGPRLRLLRGAVVTRTSHQHTLVYPLKDIHAVRR